MVRRSSSVKRKPVPKDVLTATDEKEFDFKIEDDMDVVEVIDIRPSDEADYDEEEKDGPAEQQEFRRERGRHGRQAPAGVAVRST